MTDDGNSFDVSFGSDSGDDACSLHSHADCDEPDCEIQRVRKIVGTLSQGQVVVSVATTVMSILISGAYASALLYVWVWYVLHEKIMPSVPLYITSVALATFTGGVIMKIASKIPVRIEGPKE